MRLNRWLASAIAIVAGVASPALALGVSMDPALARLLSTSFLPASIYVISRMPSDPQWADIVPIVLISLARAFVATIDPSWRASRVNPAEALRYE